MTLEEIALWKKESVEQATEQELWKALGGSYQPPQVHFGGNGPHRFEGKEKRCVYCGGTKLDEMRDALKLRN